MNKKEVIAAVMIIVVFVLVSFLAFRFAPALEKFVALTGAWGMAVYVLLAILSVVVLPLTSIPLLPVAVVLWGNFLAALLSIAGWFIGALVAFGLSRHYGRPVVGKIINLEKLRGYEQLMPRQNIFFTLIFLRMSVPVDILSYALGLFSSLSLKMFTATTLLGIIPFAFIFAYAVALPVWYQIMVLGLVFLFIYFGIKKIKTRLTHE